MNVTLRPWSESDVNLYEDMIRSVDFTYEDEEARCKDTIDAYDTLKRMAHEEANGEGIYRAVMLGDRVVGNVQVVRQNGLRNGDGNVGCVLVKESTGQGVGTEAIRQILEIAFSQKKYKRLTAIIYSPNKASIRLVEKLGFTLEATLHAAVWKNGYFYDALQYGLLQEEADIITTDYHR